MSKFINISLPQSQIAKFKRWAETVKDQNDADIGRIITAVAIDIQRWAIMFSPVKRGFLRSSIRPKFAPDRKTAWVFANKIYAPYQEFGTRDRQIIPSDAGNYGINPRQWMVESLKKRTNVRPNPFMLPASRLGAKKLYERLNKLGFHERPE
jgi:hypothetical protein